MLLPMVTLAQMVEHESNTHPEVPETPYKGAHYFQHTTFQAYMSKIFTSTENGATQLRTSGNACLDLFAEVGSARQLALTQPEILQGLFVEAWKQDPGTAFCIALWARAVRLGAGERAVGRVLLKAVHRLAPQALAAHLPLLALLGSYKDYVWVADEIPELRAAVIKLFADGVLQGDYYACKWLPRRCKLYAEVRACTGLSNAEFRRRVAAASPSVEQKLCAGKASEVEYDKLPSQAFNRYKSFFARTDAERLRDCILQKKLNTGAIYPHEVFREFFTRRSRYLEMTAAVINAQWNSLPNYLPSHGSILPVLDTSGSMTWGSAVVPRHVANPLALYCAERLPGPFRNQVVTFSRSAEFIDLSTEETTFDKMQKLLRYNIIENTNIASVFELLLRTAESAALPAEAMPGCVLILSDMQFDEGAYYDITLMDELRLRYKYAGYEFPAVVYWNLCATNTGVADSAMDNCALISGYSPRLLQAVFAGSTADYSEPAPIKLNPLEVMERALAPIRERVDVTVLPGIAPILAAADHNPTRGESSRI